MKPLKMLAIDLGASSGRGILGELSGGRLTLTEVHRFSNDPVRLGKTLHWDILRIFHEVKNAIRACLLSGNSDISTIGIDTWGVDYGLIDRKGYLLENPVHYRDGRTEGMLEEAFKVIPAEELYARTGIQFMNFNTLLQLYSAVRERPETLQAADKLLFIPDLLNYFLTGKKATEYTVASTSEMLQVGTDRWDTELLEKLGIPCRLLGEVVEPCTVLGTLSEAIQEEVGKTAAQVVNVPAHDTASAILAVPAESPDFAYISSGTWSLMGLELEEPNSGSEALKYMITNEGGVEHTTRFLKNIMGLWLVQETRRQWEREGHKMSFQELSELAEKEEPFRSLIDPDCPDFSAPGNMPERIRAFCRRTGQPVPETCGQVVRCIMESLALKYRQVLNHLDEISGRRHAVLNVVGGGTKDTMLCQFTASACGRPVLAGPTEATAIGNLMGQAIAMGAVSDRWEARRIIRASTDMVLYEPQDTQAWDAAAEKFEKIGF